MQSMLREKWVVLASVLANNFICLWFENWKPHPEQKNVKSTADVRSHYHLVCPVGSPCPIAPCSLLPAPMQFSNYLNR